MAFDSKFSRGQKFFYTHILIRDFFHSANSLGWVYLYLAGMPIIKVFVGWVLFRIIESFIAMPLAWRALQKLHAKKVLLVSLLLQGVILVLFNFSLTSNWIFILLIIIFAVADVTYWPIRKNLERFVVKKAQITQNVGFSGAISIMAKVAGFLCVAIGLQSHSQTTFLIGGFGLLLSFLPFIFMPLEKLALRVTSKGTSFFKTILLAKNLKNFLSLPMLQILIARGIVNELLDTIMPLLLAFFAVTLIRIGTTLSLLVLIGFVANILLALIQDGKRQKIIFILGLTVFFIFGVFQFFPSAYASVFLLSFGIVGVPWLMGIDMLAQTFVSKKFDPVSGGFFIEFIDDTSRILAYPLLFGVLALAPKTYFYHYVLSSGMIVVIIAIIIIQKHFRTAVKLPGNKALINEAFTSIK